MKKGLLLLLFFIMYIYSYADNRIYSIMLRNKENVEFRDNNNNQRWYISITNRNKIKIIIDNNTILTIRLTTPKQAVDVQGKIVDYYKAVDEDRNKELSIIIDRVDNLLSVFPEGEESSITFMVDRIYTADL